MEHLNPNEKRMLDYIKGKAHLRKGDKNLDRLLDMMNDFLVTINGLRREVSRLLKESSDVRELLQAKSTAYQASCQERVRMSEENRFLREKMEELK